jgi:putative transposase
MRGVPSVVIFNDTCIITTYQTTVSLSSSCLVLKPTPAEYANYLGTLGPADIADSTGAQLVLSGLIKRWPWVKHLFGDAAYDRRQLMEKAAFLDFTVEVVRRLQGQQGFAVQLRRWVVERTFAWLLRYRRLVRDYEQRIDVSENMIYLAKGSLLLHRLNFP